MTDIRDKNTDSIRQTEHIRVPVLIIGAGAAGARTAIELEEHGISPLVVSKRDHGDAHTTWARGGINASLGTLDDKDSWEIHAADTLDEGHYINDPDAVEAVCENMPDRIRELDDWGMDFSQTEHGKINQRYFGAQSFRRTCFAGDHTGESLLDTLVEKAQSMEIPYKDNVMVTKILQDDNGHVKGATAFDMSSGDEILFVTNCVVLAAGGSTAMYNRHSSREEENNGDGVALALDAGSQVMDMEFIQFHPTGMVGSRYGKEWDGRLVTEAVRGEGGRLYNTDGERFMKEYSPDQMELDARDVVARAIETEIEDGRGTENGGVYLDITHRDEEFIKERLPRMYERFMSLGVNISKEPMEVAPTAHYAMGGVVFNAETGETSVDGLRVVGETTAGVHGANRLGGNSLAETIAIGQLVGESIGTEEKPQVPQYVSSSLEEKATNEFERLQSLLGDGEYTVGELIQQLGDVLEEHAGIRRNEEQLQQGLDKLNEIESKLSHVSIPNDLTSYEFEQALDAQFMITSARALLISALERTESRGAHFRTDFTEKDASQRHNLVLSEDGSDLSLTRQSVGKPSDEVAEAVDKGYELDYHHLE